jgi:predicted nucleic acid-binding protein
LTDAYLLGLAIAHDGTLVTLDRRIAHLAGAKYAKNLLVL